LRPNNAVKAADYSGRRFGPITVEMQSEIDDLPVNPSTWAEPIPNDPEKKHIIKTFYLHELPEEHAGSVFSEEMLPGLGRKDSFLLTFKHFDVRKQRMEFVGSRIVNRSLTVEQVLCPSQQFFFRRSFYLVPMQKTLNYRVLNFFDLMIQYFQVSLEFLMMCQGRFDHLNPDSGLSFVEEVSPGKIAVLAPHDNLKTRGFISGDILCCTEKISSMTSNQFSSSFFQFFFSVQSI
jgi:hypothetical protein